MRNKYKNIPVDVNHCMTIKKTSPPKELTLEEFKNKEYFGEYISEWIPEYENKYVITGQQQGFPGLERRIGRVAQVRLEAGEFGSDNVLLRHVDNVLMQHHNQSFWLIPDKFKS